MIQRRPASHEPFMSIDSPKSIMYRNATTTNPVTSPTSIDSPKYCPVRNESPFPARRNFQLVIESRLNMATSIEDVGHHSPGDFRGRLLVRQRLKDDKGKQHGRAGGLARDNVAVGHDRNSRAGTVKIERARGIARDMLAFLKDSGLHENERCGADRAQEPPFLLLAAKPFRKGSRRLEVLGPLATAGEDYRVEIVLLRFRERRVREHGDAMGASHLGTARESRGNDLDATATKNVYRRDGLDVLEAVCEHNKRLPPKDWA